MFALPTILTPSHAASHHTRLARTAGVATALSALGAEAFCADAANLLRVPFERYSLPPGIVSSNDCPARYMLPVAIWANSVVVDCMLGQPVRGLAKLS